MAKIPITKSELARQLGTTRQNIAWHIKTGKAPDIQDVDAWREHLILAGREGTDPADMKRLMANEKLAILKAIRHDKERANRVKDDEMCSVSLTTRFIQDLVGNHFFGELDRMKHEFPSTLKGKDEVAIFEEMEKQIESAKKTLRGILDQWERGEIRKHD